MNNLFNFQFKNCMNIFVLHLNPHICAKYHCNKHVVKMIIETTQLLYTCIWLCCDNIENLIKTAPYTLSGNQGYKMVSENHPCSLWLRESLSNYEWLIELGLALCVEYKDRYHKEHACFDHVKWLQCVVPNIPDQGITLFRCVMPECYKVDKYSSFKNVTESYRNYYKGDKKRFAKWSNQTVPKWFN